MWAVADASLNSLTSFRKQLHYRAQLGKNGGGSNMHGSNGSDLDIHVSISIPNSSDGPFHPKMFAPSWLQSVWG